MKLYMKLSLVGPRGGAAGDDLLIDRRWRVQVRAYPYPRFLFPSSPVPTFFALHTSNSTTSQRRNVATRNARILFLFAYGIRFKLIGLWPKVRT